MSSPGDKAPTKIFPILLVNFIGTLGYSILLPFLIILVTKFKGNEITYGILGATYSFFQFIGAPILGKWSDKIGRRRVLLLSQGGTFLAWVLFLIALLLPVRELGDVGSMVVTLPLLLLFLARALDGITGGNVSVANAYLADISTDQNRQANFGKMGVASNLGFVAGPILAGFLGATALGEIPPVVAAMLISLVAIFVIAFGLKESLSKPAENLAVVRSVVKSMGQELKDIQVPEGGRIYSFGKILSMPLVGFLLLLNTLLVLSFSFFAVSYPAMAIETFNWTSSELGVFYSIFAGVLVLSQGPLMVRLSKRFKERQLISMGLVLLVAGFLAISTGNLVLACIGGVVLGVGNGIVSPSFLSLLANVVDPKYRGSVQGRASSLGSLASVVGLLAGGVVYASLGTLSYVFPAALVLFLAVMAFRVRRREE